MTNKEELSIQLIFLNRLLGEGFITLENYKLASSWAQGYISKDEFESAREKLWMDGKI